MLVIAVFDTSDTVEDTGEEVFKVVDDELDKVTALLLAAGMLVIAVVDTSDPGEDRGEAAAPAALVNVSK